MNAVAQLPDRAQEESFRGYFARVSPPWIEAHRPDHAELADVVQRLLDREARRHPRIIPTMRAALSQARDRR